MTFRQSDKKTIAYFEKKNQKANIKRLNYEGKEVRYVEVGTEKNKKALVIFVHGAPGSSRDLLFYLSDSILLEKARMISFDRLGYGYSDYGNAEISIEEQAKLVNAFVKEAKESTIILVGHSFGGPIIAKAAIMNTKISGILMLAPVNDPYNEKILWVSNFGKWKLTRWMMSKAWKVATDEKFTHEQELLRMKDGWQKLRVPVVHIHGGKDWIAPISNVAWSEDNIPKKHLKIINQEELDHFIPFKNHDLVVEQILVLLEK
ncbi:MAG: alpha/beta hydrolase [Cyclobacteriaceae bacterium]|nr:alpha/beta hydrolase [Cyclobacteriaceae bacterium]